MPCSVEFNLVCWLAWCIILQRELIRAVPCSVEFDFVCWLAWCIILQRELIRALCLAVLTLTLFVGWLVYYFATGIYCGSAPCSVEFDLVCWLAWCIILQRELIRAVCLAVLSLALFVGWLGVLFYNGN